MGRRQETVNSPSRSLNEIQPGSYSSNASLSGRSQVNSLSFHLVQTSPVRSDVTKPGLLQPENAPATFAWLTRDIAPSGVMGDPRPASAEKGARWLEEAASRVAAALEEMSRFPEPNVNL
jgi:creatinine amidohydrolase/Fe(II)-dependent formamide hydrolase-like protein